MHALTKNTRDAMVWYFPSVSDYMKQENIRKGDSVFEQLYKVEFLIDELGALLLIH